MALDPSTVTQIENRYGVDYVSQFTNRSGYSSGAAVDEDVLETFYLSATQWVQERAGPDAAVEGSTLVLEALAIFMAPVGADPSAAVNRWTILYGHIRPRTALSATTAVPATSEDSRRVWDGEDYLANIEESEQALYRPGRGTY